MQKVNRNGIKPKKNINKESERNTMKHRMGHGNNS